MTNQELWQSVLGEIEINLSRANFITWFKQTSIFSFKNGKVVINVDNNFTKSWLEKKFNNEIVSLLEKISKKKVKKITYKILKEDENENEEEYKKNNKVKKIKPISSSHSLNSNLLKNGLNTRYNFDNFIVGKNNELSHAAAQAVVNNPGQVYNPLFIYGNVGLGKTHLIQAIGNALLPKTKKILYATAETFCNEYIQATQYGEAKNFVNKYRNVDILIIDDIQFMGGKDGTQEAFFHTFNELYQASKQIILASDRQPNAIPAMEKRLQSRFTCGMITDIERPDYETRMAILKSKAEQRGYNISTKIIDHIAQSIHNNIRELEGALNKVIGYIEFNGKEPNLDYMANIVKDVYTSRAKAVTLKQIIKTVSSFYDISVEEIKSEKRKKHLVIPRQIAMFLMRKIGQASLPTIGYEMGGRDHTTVMYSCKKVQKDYDNNSNVREQIDLIKQRLSQTSM